MAVSGVRDTVDVSAVGACMERGVGNGGIALLACFGRSTRRAAVKNCNKKKEQEIPFEYLYIVWGVPNLA